MPILLGITVTVQIREKSAENSGKIRNELKLKTLLTINKLQF